MDETPQIYYKTMNKYFKLTPLEIGKTLLMAFLLLVMFIPAVYAYSYNLKINPSQIKTSVKSPPMPPGEGTFFMGENLNPPEQLFSLARIIEVCQEDRSHLVWFSYPASVRGRVFFGFSPNNFPSLSGGSGGGW